MAIWSKNNRACTTTWTTLRVLDQLDEVFKDSEDIMMSELGFWNAVASADRRRQQASTLASQMDNVFRLVRRAKYEGGVGRDEAVSGIIDTLINGDATVSQLAEVIDQMYMFWGEDSNE